jgi:hypothetical protein
MSEETNPLPILRTEEPISIKLMRAVEEPAKSVRKAHGSIIVTFVPSVRDREKTMHATDLENFKLFLVFVQLRRPSE